MSGGISDWNQSVSRDSKFPSLLLHVCWLKPEETRVCALRQRGGGWGGGGGGNAHMVIPMATVDMKVPAKA